VCGIVGYVGLGDPVVPVIEGLSRLEYRGYDSAGIAVLDRANFQVYKKTGKLENLQEVIKNKKLKGHLSIGHTRWATHGQVNDINAHPHANDLFCIVHNGIVENANELRDNLKAEGVSFKSETDTEVFLELLTYEFKKCNDVKKSITTAFSKTHGNSAFVVLSKDSQTIYGVKRSAPLVAGLNSSTKEIFLSSDPYALIGFADTIFFPEDEVLCVGSLDSSSGQLNFFEFEGSKSNRYTKKEQSADHEVASKGKFEHFMLKEIYEQPGLIENFVERYFSSSMVEKLSHLGQRQFDQVHIAACGTAWHAGLTIKNFFETQARINTVVELASEFRYRNPILKKSDLGLFISQSGETADTLASQELCAQEGLDSWSIVNTEGSTLFRNCSQNLLIFAGQEIGVASTKAFTLQVLTGYLLSKSFAGKLDEVVKSNILELSKSIERILNRTDEIKQIAKNIYTKKGFLFTGRGSQFPIALEGALKLKEIAYVHAEGYAAGELKHGPISLVDEEMVNIAIVTPDLYEKTYSNAEEVKARRGYMVVIGSQDDNQSKNLANDFFGIDFNGVDELQPLLVNVVLQLLSYYVAKLKGTDIDKPRNLAKSVTVE
jgi:glucosamine--fructose-6-phosphate aminotransferase (isomerizing)